MKKRVCTIGGGTGNFVTLRGLKHYNLDISAIVSMADDGGSTGILRDELGVLPTGDVRQCAVALSNSSRLMRDLMNYRFENGGLTGHSFGNLFLSALEKVTGSFEKAIEEVGKILNIHGKVIPVTTTPVRLKMELNSGKVLEGEKEVYLSQEIDKGYKSLTLVPNPVPNQRAIDEILNADVIIIGPGGLHTSLIANLLVEGIADAICKSRATKIYIVNLMNRKGQTTNYRVSDYLRKISEYMGEDVFDYILVNNQKPPRELIEVYKNEGDLVENDLLDSRVIEARLLGEMVKKQNGDLIKRNLIRHDSKKLAEELMNIIAKVDDPCYSLTH